MRFLTVLLCLFFAGPAIAQVYAWNDSQTGAKRLTNIPPPWYKTPDGKPHPRVTVYENGRLVDDTGLKDEQRLELRANSGVVRMLAPLNVVPSTPPRPEPRALAADALEAPGAVRQSAQKLPDSVPRLPNFSRPGGE